MDINLKEELQAGFYFIFEDYGTNNLVLEYFASMFIEDYFREIDLQEKYEKLVDEGYECQISTL